MADDTQHCPRCSKDLPLTAFYERHHGRRGHYCMDCSRGYQRQYKRKVALAKGAKQMRNRYMSQRRGLPRHPVFIPLPRLPMARTSPAYRDVHKRIQRARGPASSHQCVGVQCTKMAAHWAYDHTDPKEITALVRGYTVAYSTDPARYLPLCRSCHSRFDAGSAATTRTLLVAAEAWAATRT